MSNERVRSFIVDTLLFGHGKDLLDTTPLQETGIVDSTGVLEIIVFLEDHYKIRVDEADIIPENLDSIKNIKEFLKRKNVVFD